MRTNSQTNNYIMWGIILGDFFLMNFAWFLCVKFHPQMAGWYGVEDYWKLRSSFMMNNFALIIAEYFYSPIIHKRVISSGEIVKRILYMSVTQMVLAFVLLKIMTQRFPCGKTEMTIGALFFVSLLIARTLERQVIKWYRGMGRNIRKAVFVGSDPELLTIYNKLGDDATKGYHILGYYADTKMEDLPAGVKLNWLGSLQEFLDGFQKPGGIDIGDEVYVSISRRERDTIRKISNYCDQNVVHFYYLPVSVETLGMDLKRELLDDVEIFTTYENPLENSFNKTLKRSLDILLSLLFLICSLPLFPVIWLIIKTQSPGPLFFKQLRTGLDGKDFMMYKFRSMHVNDDADKKQATADDPRKYPFGNFMRKANIDELPQFWNVLKGDMSIVGPRPHMLAHTEMYSQLISKYMVRHFVKPGVTGWAQVTGFRGETKELWQMEGRVKRDIWYMEHWSIWLDIRIIWMTAKSIFVHDKNAY